MISPARLATLEHQPRICRVDCSECSSLVGGSGPAIPCTRWSIYEICSPLSLKTRCQITASAILLVSSKMVLKLLTKTFPENSWMRRAPANCAIISRGISTPVSFTGLTLMGNPLTITGLQNKSFQHLPRGVFISSYSGFSILKSMKQAAVVEPSQILDPISSS